MKIYFHRYLSRRSPQLKSYKSLPTGCRQNTLVMSLSSLHTKLIKQIMKYTINRETTLHLIKKDWKIKKKILVSNSSGVHLGLIQFSFCTRSMGSSKLKKSCHCGHSNPDFRQQFRRHKPPAA